MNIAETIVKLQEAPEFLPEPVRSYYFMNRGVLYICSDGSEVLQSWRYKFTDGLTWAINNPANFRHMMGD